MSEPFTTTHFTRLGRGLDPDAVTAYLVAVEASLAVAEARVMVLAAHADAAALRHLAHEEADTIQLEAYAAVAALHEHAIAEVERLEAGCHRLSHLLDEVDVALTARVDATSGIHIVVEPDAEPALGAGTRRS